MEQLSDKEFLAKVCNKAEKKNGLIEVTWEITGRCNLACRHCYISPKVRKSPGSGLKLSQIKSIIDQLFEMGCLNITLTGGEVFTRPDILQILRYLKNKGFSLSILTNGTLISAPIAKLLGGFNPPVEVGVSLYSLKEEVNARITGKRGALANTLRSIARLQEEGARPAVSFLVMRDNFSELDAIREFARKKRIKFSYNYFLRPRMDGSGGVMRLQITDTQVREIINKDDSLLETGPDCQQQPDLRFSKEKIFYCSAGSIAMAINPQGKANICLDLPLPGCDILKEGVEACWKKVVSFLKNTKPSHRYKCYKCELGDYCAWCPALGWRYNKDLHSCLPFYKRLARIYKEASCDA